jgi:hypothetical protein
MRKCLSCLIPFFLFTVGFTSLALGQPPRQVIDLSANWQGGMVENRFAGSIPPKAAWKPLSLPFYSGGKAWWLKQTVRIDDAWKGKRIALWFQQANYATEVFVNGQACGIHTGGFGSFEIEIGRTVKFGRPNEIVVSLSGPPINDRNESPDCVGYGTNWVWGIWGKTELRVTDLRYLKDIFVIPSVRDKNMTVRVEAAKGENLQAKFMVTDDKNTTVLESDAVKLDSEGKGNLQKFWPDPRLWSPDDPYLYRAVVQLLADGKVIDEKNVQFGFREFRIEGIHFNLNGKRINLRGDGWHNRRGWSKKEIQALFKILKQTGINVYRGHGPHEDVWLETADEMGMLLVAEGPIYQLQYMDMSHPDIWKNSQRTYHEWIRRIRNHPSVVIYSADNEVINGYESLGGYSREKEKAHAEQDRVRWMKKFAGFIREVDPTRPVEHEGDGDLDDINNIHYPHEVPFYPLYPNTTYWPINDPFACAWKYKPWDRKKPLVIGEFGKTWEGSPRTVCFLGGEEVYTSLNAYYKAFGEVFRQSIVGFRACDVAGIAPWNTSVYAMTWGSGQPPVGTPILSGIAAGFKPEAVFIKEYFTRFYAGAEWRRTLQVFNDSLRDKQYQLRWSIKDSQNRIVMQDKHDVSLSAGNHTELPVAGRMPGVETITPLTFTAEIVDGPNCMDRVSQSLRVFPSFDWKKVNRKVLLVNSSVQPFTSLASIPTQPQPGRVLILSQTNVNDKTRTTLEDYARRGMHIILLNSNSWPAGWLGISEADSSACTLAFGLAQGHPVCKNLEQGDFCYWAEDHLVSQKLLLKPVEGPMLTLVESGGNRLGMKFTPLVQAGIGKGLITVCRLDLLKKLAVEPAAGQILYNLINQDLPATVIASCPGGMAASSRSCLQPKDPVIQLTSQQLETQSAPQIESLRRQVAAGKKIFLTEARPQTLKNLKILIGQDLVLTPVECFQLRKNGTDPLLWGLSNDDLCSIVYDEWGSEFRNQGHVRWPIARFAFDPKNIKGGILLLTTRVIDATGTVYGDALCQARNNSPAVISLTENSLTALVRFHVGMGTVVVCQIPRNIDEKRTNMNPGQMFWDKDRYNPNAVRNRIFSALLTNLHAR